MNIAGAALPHLSPASQDLADYPAPLRKLLQSALRQGAQIVLVGWDPTGGQFNRGWTQIVVLYNGLLLQNSGSGLIDEDGNFSIEIGLNGRLTEADAATVIARVASVGTYNALRRLAPLVAWRATDGEDPPRRWTALYEGKILAAWLADNNEGLNVKYGLDGFVFGPAGTRIAGCEGDDLILETLRWAGVLNWSGEA